MKDYFTALGAANSIKMYMCDGESLFGTMSYLLHLECVVDDSGVLTR